MPEENPRPSVGNGPKLPPTQTQIDQENYWRMKDQMEVQRQAEAVRVTTTAEPYLPPAPSAGNAPGQNKYRKSDDPYAGHNAYNR